jgi:hypothetical protein
LNIGIWNPERQFRFVFRRDLSLKEEPIMTLNVDIIKDIAQRASLPPEKVLYESLKAYLVNKKKAYMLKRLDTLARYGVNSTEELEHNIKIGSLPEHPVWEDLIDLRNIEAEIREIEDDIKRL